MVALKHIFVIQDGNSTKFYNSKEHSIRKDNHTYIYDQKHAYKYGDHRVCFFKKNERKPTSFKTESEHEKNLKTIRTKIKELFGRVDL